MRVTLAVLMLGAYLATVTGNMPGTQRFQANKFLDMLGRTYDPSVAYVDLLTELTQRLKIDLSSISNLTSSSSGSKNSQAASRKSACQNAPEMKGVSITYTSDIHLPGSRAFYECDTGYDGMSKFIYCTQGGQWSSLAGWEGCSPVDCGIIPPNVQYADPSFSTTTYGSFVVYNCHAGYKMDRPTSNITCLDTGHWDKPSFGCVKANSPSLQKIQQLQQLATTLLEAGPPTNSRQNQQSQTVAVPASGNSMMEAFFKSMQSLQAVPSLPGIQQAMQSFQAVPSVPSNPQAASAPSAPSASTFGNNPMAAFFAQMFPNFSPPSLPTTTTTTTTAKPAVKSPGGFQLPTHLQSLLPNGLSSAAGIKPQDLMTLASMGLGSSNAAAAPRDITQLLGTMNPMSIFGGSMGMGMGGLGGLRGSGGGPGAAAAAPMEPEKVAEQREEMMMRAMMASAMKNMMSPGGSSRNATGAANRNPAMEMMTLMALQSGINGGNAGGGGGGGGGGLGLGMGMGGMDPMSMMLGGLGGGGGGGGGLFGSLFGAA